MKIPPRFITEFTEFNGKEFFEFFCDPRAFEVTIFAPAAIGVLFSRMVPRHVLSDLDQANEIFMVQPPAGAS